MGINAESFGRRGGHLEKNLGWRKKVKPGEQLLLLLFGEGGKNAGVEVVVHGKIKRQDFKITNIEIRNASGSASMRMDAVVSWDRFAVSGWWFVDVGFCVLQKISADGLDLDS